MLLQTIYTQFISRTELCHPVKPSSLSISMEERIPYNDYVREPSERTTHTPDDARDYPPSLSNSVKMTSSSGEWLYKHNFYTFLFLLSVLLRE